MRCFDKSVLLEAAPNQQPRNNAVGLRSTFSPHPNHVRSPAPLRSKPTRSVSGSTTDHPPTAVVISGTAFRPRRWCQLVANSDFRFRWPPRRRPRRFAAADRPLWGSAEPGGGRVEHPIRRQADVESFAPNSDCVSGPRPAICRTGPLSPHANCVVMPASFVRLPLVVVDRAGWDQRHPPLRKWSPKLSNVAAIYLEEKRSGWDPRSCRRRHRRVQSVFPRPWRGSSANCACRRRHADDGWPTRVPSCARPAAGPAALDDPRRRCRRTGDSCTQRRRSSERSRCRVDLSMTSSSPWRRPKKTVRTPASRNKITC